MNNQFQCKQFWKDYIFAFLVFKMAKQVTQETFDGVVRENMQEFEMTADEAVDDAVKQFESQVCI